MIEFYVPGKPETAGSKRGFVVGGRAIITDANKNTKPWQALVASAARDVYAGPLLDGPLKLSLVFFRLRPKGHFRTGQHAGEVKKSAPIAPATIPDVLKLARAVEDALSKVVWVDDARITVEILHKVYAWRSGVAVRIEPVEVRTCPAWAASLIDGEVN